MQATALALESEVLQEHWNELVENGERARDLARNLDGVRLWWRPRPGRWSVGECLEHLVLAEHAYLEVIDEAVAEGHAEGQHGTGAPDRGWFGRLLVGGVEPPARLKIPAPRRIRPERPEHPELSDRDPLARFLEQRARFARRLQAADGLDLGRVKVRSPFVPLVRVNLDTALAIVTGHERRHLAQAGEVMQHDDFPSG